MIRALVVDDHAVVRRGLRQILAEARDITVQAEASAANEVLPLLGRGEFDVVVLDINVGGVSGLELLQQIKRERPSLPVLILTVYSEDQYAVRALKSGASGFLNKEAAPDKLVEAVRTCAAGGRYITEKVAQRLAVFVASAHPGPPHDALSNRELQVLQMIASGKTVSQIARALSLSVKTISTHRARLLDKMAMKTNAELTHYAVKEGLIE